MPGRKREEVVPQLWGGWCRSEEVTVVDSIKAGTDAVATECAGEGKSVIVVGKLATYTIPCTTTPTTSYNEIGLGSSKQHVPLTVTASAGIHWACPSDGAQDTRARPDTHRPRPGNLRVGPDTT